VAAVLAVCAVGRVGCWGWEGGLAGVSIPSSRAEESAEVGTASSEHRVPW